MFAHSLNPCHSYWRSLQCSHLQICASGPCLVPDVPMIMAQTIQTWNKRGWYWRSKLYNYQLAPNNLPAWRCNCSTILYVICICELNEVGVSGYPHFQVNHWWWDPATLQNTATL